MKKRTLKLSAILLVPAAALALAGCWTPPNANVQTQGKPGLIQDGIVVESVKDPATVQATDVSSRTIVLKTPDGATTSYKADSKVKNFDRIQVGNMVQATVSEKLAIYALEDGRLPDGATAETLGVNARVLLVDPSYRLLTVQYPNGHSETFKPGLNTRLEQMKPGDSVVMRPVEVTAIRIEKP
jgi:hypothetical protein